jgi:hypothetical protein
MPVYLFRNSDTLIDYGVTDSRTGGGLPPLNGARWQFHAEIQNAMHASVFGVMDFEAARGAIRKKGYYSFVASAPLKLAS